MNIFVGNLSFEATEADVKKLFEGFGSVASVKIIMEKHGKKSRGFGFVEMPDEQQALAAIEALNSKEFMTRPLNVGPARSKPEIRHEVKPIQMQIPPKETDNKRGTWFKPVFNKKGGRYKTGRRSRSYMKQHAASADTPKPVPKTMPKPWKKAEGAAKPWKKAEGGAKPWKKRTGEGKPWRKNSKKRPRPRQSQIQSRRKPGGYTR